LKRTPDPITKFVRGLTVAAIIICGGCAKSRAVPAVPDVPPLEQLRRDISAITRLPGVEHGVWGIAVQSLDRSERLFDLNAGTLLVPASTTKLVSVASAVDAVGWDYRFNTTFSIRGSMADDGLPGSGGLLLGDLIVTGTGDPSIGGRAGSDLTDGIAALKAAGIHRIAGRVIGDDDGVEEPRPALAWAWDDLGYATGALFGALNLAENRMLVTVTPAATPGMPATLGVEPFALSRPLVNRTVTGEAGSAQLLWPEQRPGETALTIAGTIPASSVPARATISVGNPTLWFARVLRTQLINAGIQVDGEAADIDDLEMPIDRTAFTAVHVHQSRPLAEIVQPLLKESINLYAEAVMRLNAPPAAVPTNDTAIAGLRERLTAWGVPASGAQIVDGSGLSRRDVITTETLVTVLRRMNDPAGVSPWMTALPIAGVDGSLQTRMRGTPAEGNVRAKTGTMSNVRSLAGYVTTRDGEHLAFAIILNNIAAPAPAATQALDSIAIRLAAFSRG
jgi:D-alanyl-D-alanine carboxypeptidase/D-alanyl-D-alanine-endopeptidase (penicillin-binding protein 4)